MCMIAQENANILSLVSQTEADKAFLKCLKDMFTQTSKEERDKHAADLGKSGICGNTHRDMKGGMEFSCCLPKGHNGAHSCVIMWQY